MRLLHVTQRYPPAIGGAEKYIADLSEAFVQRGHQVDVFTTRALDFYTWKNELPALDRINGVNVYRFMTMRRRAWVWSVLHFGLRRYWTKRRKRYEPLILFGGGPVAPGMLWAMLTRGRQYDLMHLNCLVYSHVAYGYWAAQRLGVPVVVTPHAHAGQEVTYNLGYQRTVMAGSDHVIADTPAERELLLGLGLDPWRVSIGGTGLDPTRYISSSTSEARRQLGLPEDAFVVLFLGRKSDYKGVDLVLAACMALRSQRSDLHLLAVGPETDYSRALWARDDQQGWLHVQGAVSHAEKLAALQACDCLVLPSAGEAFGIVFLEAWILGKPVIGARTPAVSSVIAEGRDGLLANPGDPADLATCIARLAANPEQARRMGSCGRAKVLRQYTTPRIADRVEGIYLRVLRRRQREQECQ
ncbi:MAG: glycosyltransferase family 4 protein [Anaerolineae bacterium]|nr:glycosyltransferase family 4 protein [Anaerolineae bacterium]